MQLFIKLYSYIMYFLNNIGMYIFSFFIILIKFKPIVNKEKYIT